MPFFGNGNEPLFLLVGRRTQYFLSPLLAFLESICATIVSEIHLKQVAPQEELSEISILRSLGSHDQPAMSPSPQSLDLSMVLIFIFIS